MRILRMAFGDDLQGKSIVDLGCLEGGYTVEFARAGMIAVGIEARQTNIDNCEIVRKGLDLPNLTFVKDDVMNIERYQDFDASYCNGILYHLDSPVLFLRNLAKKTKKVMIVHTHIAMEDVGPNVHKLSEMTENEGIVGRWYGEHNAETEQDREQYIWSSWVNHRSFWPTKAALLQVIQDNGFDLVLEQFDWLGGGGNAIAQGIYDQQQRVMLVGVRG